MERERERDFASSPPPYLPLNFGFLGVSPSLVGACQKKKPVSMGAAAALSCHAFDLEESFLYSMAIQD